MKKTIHFLLYVSFAAWLLSSCNKHEVENLTPSEPVTDYLPLQTGKYFIYQVDSTVFTNFGRTEEVHSYQEKDVIDTQLTDNLNRSGYRVYRFLRESAGTEFWKSAGTYFITTADNQVEVNENNMRTIRLITPIKEGTTWHGNHYLSAEPFASQYTFSNDDGMAKWEFKITKTNESISLNGKQIDNVTTVLMADNKNLADTFEVSNNQVQVPANISAVWVTGNATDTITLSTNTSSQQDGFVMFVYNRSNYPLKLNNISVPQNLARSYEYVNGSWMFGSKDTLGRRVDTLYSNTPYGYKDYSVDKYAKGIGLVYQELIMWEYQPNTSGPSAYQSGFGVKRTLLEHN